MEEKSRGEPRRKLKRAGSMCGRAGMEKKIERRKEK